MLEKCNKCGCSCHKDTSCMCECAVCDCKDCQPSKDATVQVTGVSLSIKKWEEAYGLISMRKESVEKRWERKEVKVRLLKKLFKKLKQLLRKDKEDEHSRHWGIGSWYLSSLSNGNRRMRMSRIRKEMFCIYFLTPKQTVCGAVI